MPGRIPAGTRVCAAFVFPQANDRHDVHERRGIGIGHVRPDSCRVVGIVGISSRLEDESQLHGLIHQVRVGLKFDVHIRFRALILAYRAIRPWRAVIPQHHVVLDHAPASVAPDSGPNHGGLNALYVLALLDIGTGTVQTGFLVVPQGKADAAF